MPQNGDEDDGCDAAKDARAFMIAKKLIEKHGDNVGAILEDKIVQLRSARDMEQLADWFTIRNAVAITLWSGHSEH